MFAGQSEAWVYLRDTSQASFQPHIIQLWQDKVDMGTVERRGGGMSNTGSHHEPGFSFSRRATKLCAFPEPHLLHGHSTSPLACDVTGRLYPTTVQLSLLPYPTTRSCTVNPD